MRLRTSDLAAACGGTVVGPDVEVSGATQDSREIAAGQLFVPLLAERDGHDFVAGATAGGAAAYLSQRGPIGDLGTCIEVADTAAALLDLGRLARTRLGGVPVVGVTGSVGKTSAKDLLRAALGEAGAGWSIAAAERSFNNEIGVPLTLLNAPDDAAAAVIEMGARGIGHIALLSSIAHPTIGVITAVAEAHTEHFGSIEGVAIGKGELVEALPSAADGGVAILNAADHRVAAMASRTTARVVLVGTAEGVDGDVRIEGLRLDDQLRPRFTLRTPGGDAEVALEVRGLHQAGNAALAAAAALAAGAPLDAVVRGLEHAALSAWRMAVRTADSGLLVINDAYNANPASMAAGLRSLAELGLPGTGRRVAILGAMAELGEVAADDHLEVVALANSLGIDVIAVATPGYGSSDAVVHVPDVDAAAAEVARRSLGDGDAVLLKGSRVAGIERVDARL